jgi:transcriptional regulator with XRE-family HTH domain
MSSQAWRERLQVAVDKTGRSQREISLAAGLSAGYLHSILTEGKAPSIENALRLCAEVGVSLSYLLSGFEISPETEEILRLLESQPQARSGILQILRSKSV